MFMALASPSASWGRPALPLFSSFLAARTTTPQLLHRNPLAAHHPRRGKAAAAVQLPSRKTRGAGTSWDGDAEPYSGKRSPQLEIVGRMWRGAGLAHAQGSLKHRGVEVFPSRSAAPLQACCAVLCTARWWAADQSSPLGLGTWPGFILLSWATARAEGQELATPATAS